MLILTRKIDQGIIISGNICIRVLGVQRDRVKIGISAPVDIAILREELLEKDGEAAGELEAKKNRVNAENGADPKEITMSVTREELSEREN